MATELAGFREKSARFRYLFERVCRDVRQIVLDTAGELRRSDFVPLSFELDVSRLEDGKPEKPETEADAEADEGAAPEEGGEDFRLTGIFLLNGCNRFPPGMTGKLVHIALMSLGDSVIERLDPSYDVFLLTSKSRERQHGQDC